ncbi:MAG: hypothetical protein LBU69_03680 [Deltaproteobacteria bacterium]|jgi:hypothetical protein|nr:hypothetical protein [Deltaproteobacteria bacterium]
MEALSGSMTGKGEIAQPLCLGGVVLGLLWQGRGDPGQILCQALTRKKKEFLDFPSQWEVSLGFGENSELSGT